jgi:hypothetical protein
MHHSIDVDDDTLCLRCPPLTLLNRDRKRRAAHDRSSEEGGRIDIRITLRDGNCHVLVSDTGVGLALEFWQQHRVRAQQCSTAWRCSRLAVPGARERTMNRRPTALIADDEPLLRETMVRLLAQTWPELDIIA